MKNEKKELREELLKYGIWNVSNDASSGHLRSLLAIVKAQKNLCNIDQDLSGQNNGRLKGAISILAHAISEAV